MIIIQTITTKTDEKKQYTTQCCIVRRVISRNIARRVSQSEPAIGTYGHPVRDSKIPRRATLFHFKTFHFRRQFRMKSMKAFLWLWFSRNMVVNRLLFGFGRYSFIFRVCFRLEIAWEAWDDTLRRFLSTDMQRFVEVELGISAHDCEDVSDCKWWQFVCLHHFWRRLLGALGE